MRFPQRTWISAAILAAFAAGPAGAALERMGPVNKAPTVGGFPAWVQDRTGITLEFCDLKTQAEQDGGWCLIGPGLPLPENFPSQFADEHFYYGADNVIKDANVPGGFDARLVLAMESAFVNGPPVDGDQVVFGRSRIVLPRLPFDGDYRVITPFSDVTYYDRKAGDKISETSDIGLGCPGTFDCALSTAIGPYLLPSAVAGGAELPPMPDLRSLPVGTDPFFDALVTGGGATADPGTGKKYIADPGRVGAVTGSPLPNFIDHTGASRSHNTFRIEVRRPSPTHDGELLYVADGERNFTLTGRLLTGPLPGKVTPTRATYKADATGAVTDLDVFATASPTSQARLPGQPQPAPATPVLNMYDTACGGALTVDPVTGDTRVNAPPYTAPAGVSHPMAATAGQYWAQSQPGGQPPSHVCVEDANARNASGQVVPEYHLKAVSDDVTISAASYDGQANGTLTVNAISSDPTAVLTLAGYGPAPAETPGAASGAGAGTGVELAGNAATVSGLLAPPAQVQVISSRRGVAMRNTETARGAGTPGATSGVPTAVNESATLSEDCSPTAATFCSGPQLTMDLIANDTIVRNGSVVNLRDFVNQGLGTVTVTAQAPLLGLASITADGVLTYQPNANANGLDNVAYTVTVDGQVSNQAIAAISITPVNDVPVAGNLSVSAAVGVNNTVSLIAASTDPDGNTDVKDAIIDSWPAGLGAQPLPSNGSVSFAPTAGGTYSITFRVKDAAGVVSGNSATASVTVAAETINITRALFERGTSTRWRVDGTDSILSGQTLSVVYADGVLRSTGAACNGTAADPSCVVGTPALDAAGLFKIDRSGTAGGTLDPTDSTTWSVLPRNIKVFSSAPVLGGSRTATLQIK